MLAESGKFVEMEEKIKKVRSKHKQEPKMWLELAKIYYMLQKFQEARYLKQLSLKSIQNKKTRKFSMKLVCVKSCILEAISFLTFIVMMQRIFLQNLYMVCLHLYYNF